MFVMRYFQWFDKIKYCGANDGIHIIKKIKPNLRNIMIIPSALQTILLSSMNLSIKKNRLIL